MFPACYDNRATENTIVEVFFPQIILARYVRFEPLTRMRYGLIYQELLLRMELIGSLLDDLTEADIPTTQGTVF